MMETLSSSLEREKKPDPYGGLCDESIYGRLPEPCAIFKEYPVAHWTEERRMQLILAILKGRITEAQARHLFHLLPQQLAEWLMTYKSYNQDYA